MIVRRRWILSSGLAPLAMVAWGGCSDAADMHGPADPPPVVASGGEAAPADNGPPAVPEPVSEPARLWPELVNRHVRAGRFDYAAAERAAVTAAVMHYARAPLPAERAARLALWINAYNANVVELVLAAQARGGFTNVVNEAGFFDRTRITVCGEDMTLNGLENDRIRALDDPRIHAALVCAAVSCPPLRDEAFDAERLEAQLDEQCQRWINDPTKFGASDQGVQYSRILDWYGKDFDAMPYGSRHGFVLAYADPAGPLARAIAANPHPEIEWREYDWTLNQAP